MARFMSWLYNILTGRSRWLRKQMTLWAKLDELKINLDGQDKLIYCSSRCQTPWIGIGCSTKTCSEEPQSTTREESQRSLRKLSSQVFLVTSQPATLIPTAINLRLPLLICMGTISKKLRRWRSICNHSSAPLALYPRTGLNCRKELFCWNNTMSSPHLQKQPLSRVAVSIPRLPLQQQHLVYSHHILMLIMQKCVILT